MLLAVSLGDLHLDHGAVGGASAAVVTALARSTAAVSRADLLADYLVTGITQHANLALLLASLWALLREQAAVGVRAGFLALTEHGVLLVTLPSLQLLHDLDGGGFDLLPTLRADGSTGTQDDSSILITSMSHIRLDPGRIIIGNTEHLQGSMQVLLVDLGEVVPVQLADLLGLLPGDRRGDNDKVAVALAGCRGLAGNLVVTIGEAALAAAGTRPRARTS